MVFYRDLPWASSWYELAAHIMYRLSRFVVNRGQKKALEQGRWHDTMDGALNSGESETTLPIIARLHNITCPPP